MSGRLPQIETGGESTGQPFSEPVVTIPRGKPPLRTAAAQFLKEVIWRTFLSYRPVRKPIALYASRRSGSTLLMEVIAVNPRVMFSDQPFSLFTASSANLNRLPIFPYGQLAFPDSEEEQIISAYLSDLLAGRLYANAPWKIWTPEFHFRNDRLCLKITDAKALIDWIDQKFLVDTVVSTRHPIAQALSVSRLGWLTTGKGFLRNEGYVSTWLDARLESRLRDLYRTGNEWRQRIADWCLENLPMLRLLPVRPRWTYVAYEELVSMPSRAVPYLAMRLDLPAVGRMVRRVGKPSRSTKRESSQERQQLIEQGRADRLVGSWLQRATPEQIAECADILDWFELDLYVPTRAMPNRSSVGRETLPEDVAPRGHIPVGEDP